MGTRSSWSELIPLGETRTAAEFLVHTWRKLAKKPPRDFHCGCHEPKLTEMLHLHLTQQQANSGLTGLWINEGQNSYYVNGKIKRIKKDITYFTNATIPLELIFEFKKLATSSLATYRGEKGMHRFVDGHYAIGKPLAVMVGLIQDDPAIVIGSLETSLLNPKNQEMLHMVISSASHFVRNPSGPLENIAVFDTEHERPTAKAPPNGTITIAHIFLNCPSQDYLQRLAT